MFLETKYPKIKYRNFSIPVENIKLYIDFLSLLKAEPKIEKINLTLEELDINTRVGFQSARVAVTGTKISPPLFESIFALGKETTIARLAESIEKL